MSKIKNLSDLGELYSAIQQTAANVTEVKNSNEQPDILLTDATNYLPKGSTPKVGEGFGKKEEKLAPKTGPEAAEGFDKKLAKEEQEAAEETEKEKKDMEAAEKNEEAPEKEEKVEENVESVSKSPKYKKQTFTMPKSKFQKLYEDAINSGPFVNEEEEVAPIAPPAGGPEGAAEEPMADHEMGGEETHLTHAEAIEACEKLLAFLKKDMESDEEQGTLGAEDQAGEEGASEEEEAAPMEEAVEAEDLGHPLEGAKSDHLKDGHKIHKVGSLKQKGAASEQGANFKNEPAPKKEKESAHLKDGHKLHTAGSLKVDKGQSNMFEQ
jgi:hypothetical protein